MILSQQQTSTAGGTQQRSHSRSAIRIVTQQSRSPLRGCFTPTGNDEERRRQQHSSVGMVDVQPTVDELQAPQEWLQSPPRLQNPYTGQVVQMRLPERLQQMVHELQGHSDWFQLDENGSRRPGTPEVMDGHAFQMPVRTPRTTHRRPQPDEDALVTPVAHHGERMTTAPTIVPRSPNGEGPCRIKVDDAHAGCNVSLSYSVSASRLDDSFTLIRVPAKRGVMGMMRKEFAQKVGFTRYKSMIQQMACEHVANREDTVMIAPCGSGKSMTFVHAALNSGGKVNIVIEPLNAIIKSHLIELQYLSAHIDIEQLFSEKEARERQVLSSYYRMQMIINDAKVSTIERSRSRDTSLTIVSHSR